MTRYEFFRIVKDEKLTSLETQKLIDDVYKMTEEEIMEAISEMRANEETTV